GGIINLASDINYYRTAETKNIPIINVLTFIFSETPGVIFSLASLYNNFFSLVKGHKDSIFIGFDLIGINMLLKREAIDNFVQDCDNLYMQGIQYVVSNLYNFIKIPEKMDFSGVEEHLDKAFSQIRKPPYAIVFCDDVLYTRAYPLFEKYDRIFSNTKIITHSNGFNVETGPYRAVKVEFDLNEAAQASLRLIISLMNRDQSAKRNIIIEPKIKE
ncbi:MAG: hypothetical protein KBT47_08875, partial [Armatimonadetes bacterium]|nr:hypothetical protein [Candidatus Hippobium faecium]